MKRLTILVFLVAAIFSTPGYFVIRSFFPLDRPEFEGRTIWEVLDDREQRFIDRAANYPDAKVYACTVSQNTTLVLMTGWATFCGAADVNPELRKFVGARDVERGCGAVDAKPFEFWSLAWKAFEDGAYEFFSISYRTSVPYCRIGF